ncbi:hypothetical protein [Rhabdothermincola sediminis]|uniref:hypothetical protein n=1 Tax=Rhabdothermincola sediminis TaxID=2751370 RepID=UPI001AA018D5|nr:hypothetical protein [Rhabdothermincola sediminis]
MASIARADNDGALSDADVAAITLAAAILFRLEEPVGLRALPAIETAELRRNRESITGERVEDTGSYGEWLMPYRTHPDPDLVARYRALAECPRAPSVTSSPGSTR